MGKHTTEMKMVPTLKLIPYVNNARTHSQEQVNKLRGSLREFGFINPVIIDADYNVIAGHGRLMAAKEEGIGEVPYQFQTGGKCTAGRCGCRWRLSCSCRV